MAFVHHLSSPHHIGGGVLSVALLSRPWKFGVSVVPIGNVVAKGSKRRKRASAAEAFCAVSPSQTGKGLAGKEAVAGVGKRVGVGAVDDSKRPVRRRQQSKLPQRAGRQPPLPPPQQQQKVSSNLQFLKVALRDYLARIYCCCCCRRCVLASVVRVFRRANWRPTGTSTYVPVSLV